MGQLSCSIEVFDSVRIHAREKPRVDDDKREFRFSHVSSREDIIRVAAYQAPLLSAGSMDALGLIRTLEPQVRVVNPNAL
ncbi:MAG TPA: hypothetical protein VEZ90_17685, partial [Blastocatellia bacterium]|nr:hypothetical protein [Blastocatellia bacterium]